MKVLLCHKFFHKRGGSETFLFQLIEILSKNGHEVIPFSMKNEKNFNTSYSKYFVSNIDYQNESKIYRLKKSFKILSKVIYSLESRNEIEALIKDTKPDIAHINLIYHHISPSILHSLKKYNIPTVLNSNDCKLVCPNYYLFNPLTGKICEKCVDGNYYHCFFEKCFKGSRLASFLATSEMYIHKFLRIYEDNVDIFIAPSGFMENMLIKGGFNRKKIRRLSHPIDVNSYKPCYEPGNYYIYAGRLIREKGLLTLLEASNRVKSKKLVIAGFESDKEILKKVRDRSKYPNIEYVGPQFGEDLLNYIKSASFSIVPSECYDILPIAAIESFALGKPVIGANIGGIPEIIDDGINGFLFEPGNIEDLSKKFDLFIENPSMVIEFGKRARKKVETYFSNESYYKNLLKIYNELIPFN